MSRRTVPKYSWEILAIQVVVIIACIVLLVLDEYRLYAYLALPLGISYVIQYYRIRRARQRMDREWGLKIRQAVAEYQYRAWGLHEPQHDINDDLKCLREEIETAMRWNRIEEVT